MLRRKLRKRRLEIDSDRVDIQILPEATVSRLVANVVVTFNAPKSSAPHIGQQGGSFFKA